MVKYANNAKQLTEIFEEIKNTDDYVELFLGPGEFQLSEEIKLRSNICISGIKGKTFLKGSIKISTDDGKPYKNRIFEYDLTKYGIDNYAPIGGGPYGDYWSDYETMKPHLEDSVMGFELFYQNKPMPISRFPKTGFINIKETKGSSQICDPYGVPIGFKEGLFTSEDDRVLNWKNEYITLIGYWLFDWAMQRHHIESTENGVIKVDEPYHIFGYGNKGHFYGINVLSELNTPGEWCLNRTEKKLYIMPYENQDHFSLSVAEHLFILENCQNITIKNIVFEEVQKAPLILNNCKNINISDCTIRNSGSWALIGSNCSQTCIKDCIITQTGGGGISLDGGERNTLTSSNNVIEHNDIYNLGHWHRVYTPGIRISGVGCLVSHNKVHDVPALGILFHGNNHIIQNNELYNTCYESNDCGAIYAGKDWSCRGNVIRYNYFHDMPGYMNNGCIALYFDDAFSSAEVYENLFFNVKTSILVGGGRDFHIYSNKFINSGGICIDDRLDNWAGHSIAILEKYLKAVDYQNDIWKKEYPTLTHILDSKNITMPEGNVVENNISNKNECLSISEKAIPLVRQENNIIV